MLLTILIIITYLIILAVFIKDFRKGLQVHKATLSYRKFYIWPRYTVRLPNGRFKANKVGIFYVATH